MATKGKARVRLSGAFPAGAKVGLYERTGDAFIQGGKPVKTATVKKDSTIEFEGLPESKSFFVALVEPDNGDQRPRAVTAKVPDPTKKAEQREPGFDASLVSQTAGGDIVSGPRNTVNTRVRGHAEPPVPVVNPQAGKPTPEGDKPPTPPEQPRIEDAPKGQAFESHTFTGEAVPAVPDEERPALPQSEVPKGAVQESATELGEATIIEDGPVRQEDVPDGVFQESSTAHGAATVLPDQPEKKTSRSSAKGGKKKPNRTSRSGKSRSTKATQRQSAASTGDKPGKGSRKPGTGNKGRKR